MKYYSGENTDNDALTENPKAAGTYTIKVTKEVTTSGSQGGDNAESTIKWGTATFTIKKASLGNGVTIEEKDSKVTSKVDDSQLTNYYDVKLNGVSINNDVNLTATWPAVESQGKIVRVTATGKSENVVDNYAKDFYIKTNLTGNALDTTSLQQTNTLTYDGKYKKPAFNLKLANGTSLKEGTDYVLTGYGSNINANTSASVTIKGINAYCGEKSATYVINPKSITGSNTTVTANNIGAGKTPDVKVVCDGETLKQGTDYVLTSIDTSTTGSRTATITGTGNYTGTRTASFSVVKTGYDVSAANVTSSNYSYTNKTYTGSAQYPDYLTVTLTPSGESTRTLVKGTDYTVSYEYTKDGKTYTTTSPKDAYAYTIVITGKGRYGGVQRAGTFTISAYNLKDANISVTVASATSTPSVSVRTTGGTYFTKDVDYTLRYTPNYNKTKVTVTLSGMGTNLTGYYSKDYSVYSTSISYCTLSFADNKTSAAYTGYTIPKTVVVKYGSATLTQGSDYDLTIKNAAGTTVTSVKDAGTYTFTVTGKNGWYGSSSITFTVTGNDISTYNVVLDKTSISATGSNVTLPKVTRVYSGSSTLSTSEYTVRYQNAAGTTVTSAYAPGTYKVVVTGAGKYSGSTSATFTIVGKNQTITGVSSTYKKYKTSEAFQLSPSATEGSFTYTSSDSSVATVSSTGLVTPLKAGRAKITIKTTGNSKYNPAEYSTVIKVYPNRAVLTQKPWTAGDSKVKVRWNKQEGATRYEVRYSRSKSFASGTYLTKKVDAAVNSYDTQSTTLKNLTSGSKYYVKVRAVTEVYNDYGKKLTYYGNWSKWKSVVAE